MLLGTYLLLFPQLLFKAQKNHQNGHHSEIPHGNHDIIFISGENRAAHFPFLQLAQHHSCRYARKDFALTLQVFANSLQNFQSRTKRFRRTRQSISSLTLQPWLCRFFWRSDVQHFYRRS